MATFEFWNLGALWVYSCPRCGTILDHGTAKEFEGGLFFCSDCLQKEILMSQSPVLQAGYFVGDSKSPDTQAA
jgi:hypothetical protein